MSCRQWLATVITMMAVEQHDWGKCFYLRIERCVLIQSIGLLPDESFIKSNHLKIFKMLKLHLTLHF